MDLSEYPGYQRRCHSNQGAERQDKFTKTKSKSHHLPNKNNVLTSLSEPIINVYSRGNVWNGQQQSHHGNNDRVSLIHQRQFPDQTLVKSGNSLFTAARKVGPLHRKYCDTDNSSSVYGPEDIGICSSRKFTPSENVFSERWQDSVTQVETPKPNPKMVSRPEVRVLNESYVTSALAAEDDYQDSGKHRPVTSRSTKSNGMEKIGQVSAAVPPAGSSTVAATWRNYQLGISNPVTEQDGNKLLENAGTSYQKNAFCNDDLPLGTTGASREISMKLNKALKKYDGLDKIREKIKRQQLSCKENKKPDENHEAKVMLAGDDTTILNGIQDVTNGHSHPVMMEEERPNSFVRMPLNHRSHKMADVEESERHVKVRKIATTVSSPSYKGFTDLKEKLHGKSTNVTSKQKKAKVDCQTNDKVLTSKITSDKCESKTNLTEPASDKNKSRHKDLITPSSWREGQETIRRLLGPPKKIHATKPASVVANQEELNLEESKLTVGARQMLKDLQLSKNIEINKNATSLVEEDEDKFIKEPKLDSHPEVKPLPHAVKRKPAKSKEAEKQAKVRHYDPEEVRKFIAKKKDERFRKTKEDITSRLREGLKRQEMLQEVYRKQKEATAAQRKEVTSSRCKSKEDLPKSTDIKEKPASDVKYLVGGSHDMHFDDDTHSTLTIDSYDGSLTPIATPIRSFSTAAATLPMKTHSLSERTGPSKSTYPHPVIPTFELNPTSLGNNHPTSAAPSIDMSSYPAKSIPANLYSEKIEMSHRRRIMDIHSSAATLTNKLRNIYKQSSAADLLYTDSVPQSSECYSPKRDILSGTGPTYVGTLLDDNLPGVLNLRLKAQEIFEKKEQDAATRIQAVYRGYMVRKNLKWQYLTGLPDIDGQVTKTNEQKSWRKENLKRQQERAHESTSAFQPNSFQDQSDASSVNSFDLSKAPKFKSLFHNHLAAERQSVNPNRIPCTREIKDYKRQPRSLTVYPKYPWEEDGTTDQFSIVNTFASKYKNFLPTDSDHSSENGIAKHVAKLHSPVTLSPVSSIGSNKDRFIPHPPTNLRRQRGCTEQTSDWAKPVKTDLHLMAQQHEISHSLENKNEESLMKAEELQDVSSENDSNNIDGTRSKTSSKSASRRGTSARKKLNLYKVPSKSVDPDSHTDTSFPSFSEDSEISNRSTSDAPLRSQSSLGNSTDSDVPNLLNEQAKIRANPSHPTISSYSQHHHRPGKDATDLSMVKKRYAPSTLPMRLRAELYNFEQTVETVSLAQQGTFSLGQIFQNLEQTKNQERDYWNRLRHEVDLLEEENPGPKSEILENSEALISGEQSFSLKSITANEERKRTSSKHESESLVTQTRTHTKDIPSRTESVSKPKISDSLHSHSEYSHSLSASGGGGGKYLKTSSPQTESKRRSHHKNGHESSHRDSHSDGSSSSRCSVKTASDFRGAEETSDSIAEDISDGSNIEASLVSASIPEQSHLSSNQTSNPKEAWKVQLEEEKQRAHKEDSIWQSKLQEVQEKLNSLQHPLVKKELDEVLPELVKRKLVVFAEVPRMMAELQRLTEKQESSSREHYQRVKSLLKSQAKIPERKSRRSKDHSKSDSEIYGQPISSKELGSNPNHGQKGQTSASKEKCLVEKKLEVKALEKRLQHEGKYLHKLKKETLKKYNESNADITSLTGGNCSHVSYSTSSIKEDVVESGEKQNSRRRVENSSNPSDHSISEVFNATSPSCATSYSTTKVGKVHFPVSDGSRGGGGVKSSVSEEIQEKWSQSSNGSKSKRPLSRRSDETSIAEDIENSTTRRNDDEADVTSSYTKKTTKPSASESGDDTATNDEYSRSFETSISSSCRASPVRRLPQPLVGTRNQSSPFKSSRCRLRGSESDTEDSFQSETLSDASDIEVRIRALSEDLKKKKLEADRLRQEKKAKYREKLKAQEESLLKQIEAYDNYIEEIKADLQKEQKSSNNKGVKPQIKQPKVSESRKFKQRSAPDVSSVQMSKRDSTGSSADETQPSLPLSPIKSDLQAETSVCSGILSPRFPAGSKGDNSKPQQLSTSSASPLASHVLSQNIQTELQSAKSTEIKSASIAEEIEEKTLSSVGSVSNYGTTMTANKESAPSSKDVLPSVKVDLVSESASAKSRQLSMKTDEKSPETEDQLDSEHLTTDKSVQLASAVSETPTSICEKFEFGASSSALSKCSDNNDAILKLNLKEEKETDSSSFRPVNVESEEVKLDQESAKADNKRPTDLTSVSEQYSQNFEEVDNSTSSNHNLPSFCDDEKKEDEISQFSLDKTASEDEQEDEISEQISLRSDTSERTSSSKSLLVSKGPRDEPDGQFSNSANCSSHAISLIPQPCLDKEATEERSSDLEVKKTCESSLVIGIEDAPLQESIKDSTFQRSSQQIDNVVDEIFDKLVSTSVSTICKIATEKKETMANAKKAGPPVLPKPKRKTSPVKKLSLTPTEMTTTGVVTVTVNEKETPVSVSKFTSPSTVLKESKVEEETESKKKKQILHQKFTDDLMESLLVGSIKNVLDIRSRRIGNSKRVSPATSPQEIKVDEKKVTMRRGSSFEPSAFSLDEDPFLWSLSLDSDSSDDFSPAADNDDFERNVPRPHSPLPNEPKLSLSSPSDEITDKNIWPDVVPHETPPPPYPGRLSDGDTCLELHNLSKELYAVPQKRAKIDELVSSAVETLWQVKTSNHSLIDATMPDCFLTVTDDLVSEMDQQSCRSYKKMLFDLTREIIEEVYEGSQDDDGNNNNNPIKECSRYPMAKLVHRKCQPVINKYYRQSRSPPSTPEELQKVVQDAVGNLLHLENLETGNGNTRKRQEFDKWNSSKKDHVDRVLIEELKEEEPHWVDYDDDVYELKVQLSHKIFDSLVVKTVETFKNIYKKRNERLQQQLQVPL